MHRDRLPFLTGVPSPHTPSLVPAFNTLEANFFLPTGEPYPIDSDDGCNHLNVSSNVIIGNAVIKTDFGGHTKRSLLPWSVVVLATTNSNVCLSVPIHQGMWTTPSSSRTIHPGLTVG